MATTNPLHRCHSEKPSASTGHDGPARSRWLTALKAEPGTTKYIVKNHFIAMVGEFVGTTLFLVFALGGADVASRASNSVAGGSTRTDMDSAGAAASESVAQQVNVSSLLYIALSFGLSLAVNVWIFFRVSGGLFNPVVSLGLWLIGQIKATRAMLLVVAQIAGSIAASGLVYALLPGNFNVQTTLSSNTSIVRGVFIEMFLTAMLCMAIFMLAAEKSRSTFIAPVAIGLALFIAEMLGVAFTGGSLNPARSFGPAVVTGTFVSYHYIYWIGPAAGATIAAGFYHFLKFLDYETCQGPDCDGDGSCALAPPMQPPPTSLMMELGPSRRSHRSHHSHHDHDRELGHGGSSLHAAPAMGYGMSTQSVAAVVAPRINVVPDSGDVTHPYRLSVPDLKGDADSISKTLRDAGGADKDQLDRIEMLLAQLISAKAV
ncbi:hypothetical protein JCM10212_003960 [Sporobolomyces blumeae]